MSDDAKDEAEEEDWRLARYFKLHLHPAELRTSHNLATEGETSSHRWKLENDPCRLYEL
jgi:hypothetical protein